VRGTRRRRASRLALAAIAALATVAATLAGCSLEQVSQSEPPTPTPQPTPTRTTYQLDRTVWYAGLVITFTAATAQLDARGGTVSIQTAFANPTADDRTLEAPIRLIVGSRTFGVTQAAVPPVLPAGGTGYTTLRFEITGLGSVDDAVLEVGLSGEHQAVVPLLAGQATPVTLEPLDVPVSGNATAHDLRVVVRSAELRWDLPDWALELPAGRAILTVVYDASYRGSFSGGLAFTGDNVALRLPDGSTVTARPDGRSQSIVLIGAGATERQLMTRFEIPASLPGTYALVVLNGQAEGAIEIDLPG
jgi:hypothetical protein